MLASSSQVPVKTLLVSLKHDAKVGVVGESHPYGAHASVAVASKTTPELSQETAIQKNVPVPNTTLPKTTCFTPVVAALMLPSEANLAPGALNVPSSK